jgi:hypothetical protein
MATARIVQDRIESDELASVADTTGSDMETAGTTLRQYTDEVEAKVAEAFQAVRPLIEQTVADANSQFTALESRYGDSVNEGAFQTAALAAVGDGRSAFERVLAGAQEDEAVTEAAVVQAIADYVNRTVANVQAPAQATNESLSALGGLVSQQQANHEELDASLASRVSGGTRV